MRIREIRAYLTGMDNIIINILNVTVENMKIIRREHIERERHNV